MNEREIHGLLGSYQIEVNPEVTIDTIPRVFIDFLRDLQALNYVDGRLGPTRRWGMPERPYNPIGLMLRFQILGYRHNGWRFGEEWLPLLVLYADGSGYFSYTQTDKTEFRSVEDAKAILHDLTEINEYWEVTRFTGNSVFRRDIPKAIVERWDKELGQLVLRYIERYKPERFMEKFIKQLKG